MFYRYREPISGSDIFAGLILFLVIAAVLAMMALYIGAFILFIFLGIGVGIAFIYAIVVYIKSFATAIPTMKKVSGSGVISTIFLRYFVLLKETSILTFKDNISIAHSSLIKAHSYRLFSFKKWMWLIVAPSILIIGSGLIILLAFLQFGLLFYLAFHCLCLIGLIIVCCSLVSFVEAVIHNFTIIKTSLISNSLFCFNFYRTTTYRIFLDSTVSFFNNYILVNKDEVFETLKDIKNYYYDALSYGILHIKRYYNLGKILSCVMVTILSMLLLFIISFILFISLFISNFVWATVTTIFYH